MTTSAKTPRKKTVKSVKETAGTAPQAASAGIIKLPLGKCLTAPNSRFYTDLKKIAHSLARCRNRMARFWQRFREDFPSIARGSRQQEDFHFDDIYNRQQYHSRWLEWSNTHPPRSEADREKRDKLRARWLKWVEEDGFSPPVVERDGRWVTFESVLYEEGRLHNRTPEGGIPISHIATGVLSRPCAQDVLKDLLAKTSYRHTGSAKYRWEGVLSGEIQLADYSESLSIPVKNSDSVLAWDTSLGVFQQEENAPRANVSSCYSKVGLSMQEAISTYGKSECVLAFKVFSREAHRKQLFHVVRINTRFLPEGMKEVVKRVIAGEWSFSDSSIHFDEVRPNSKRAKKGHKSRWVLHLCYNQPGEESRLDKNREGYLVLNPPEALNPFEVGIAPGTQGEVEKKSWQCGFGQAIKKQFARIEARRESMRFRHRVRGSGRRSHGHQREYRDVKEVIQKSANVARDCTLKTVVDIVRYCVRNNLGTLNFTPPSLGYRPTCWFPKNNVPMNWTLFVDRLKHECWQKGVVLNVG